MIYEIVNCSPFFLRLTERLFHVLQQSIQYPPLQKQLKEMGFDGRGTSFDTDDQTGRPVPYA